MKVVYMGTPDFAVAPMESILAAGHEIIGVFTQPDKPKGRGYELAPPPVKVCALAHSLTVYQPKTLKDGAVFETLRGLHPDVIVVAAYGKILPGEIIHLPEYGCINIHASLLPKYRGAAPIQRCILDGETETGVTVMYMDEGLDTGDMLIKESTPIGPDETAGSLHDRLAQMGAALIVNALALLSNGMAPREKQDGSLSCYASMLDKSISGIDWNKTNRQVHNQVRGLNPWPVASSALNGKTVKIFKTECSAKQGEPGTVLSIEPLTVACLEGAVEILELQLEGKKRMNAADFLRGHKILPGSRFG